MRFLEVFRCFLSRGFETGKDCRSGAKSIIGDFEMPVPSPNGKNAAAELRELAWLFGKLGFVAFGGPAAPVAMMRQEVVERRRWMDDQEFLDLIGATNLIPGPNSTELAIHIGRDGGACSWPGLASSLRRP
jgi:hypothetical protein